MLFIVDKIWFILLHCSNSLRGYDCSNYSYLPLWAQFWPIENLAASFTGLARMNSMTLPCMKWFWTLLYLTRKLARILWIRWEGSQETVYRFAYFEFVSLIRGITRLQPGWNLMALIVRFQPFDQYKWIAAAGKSLKVILGISYLSN